ncbi:MAG: alcohol dehydrogenase catalytic domain-containing protein, partial [Phycisphaerae bacterium]|nr:alcohol dehydrogenase catalytic domain-containing protein [Phycisphaerae bacterium]
MRAIEFVRQGTPVASNVQYCTTRPAPEPAPGEVLVRTLASALNHLDLWVGRGLPNIKVDWPTVSGSDGVGVVERVGAGVDAAWIGRRVVMNAAIMRAEPPTPHRAPAGEDVWVIGEHGPGAHAELFVAPATQVLDIGDTDPVQAAAFGLAHLTAWRM